MILAVTNLMVHAVTTLMVDAVRTGNYSCLAANSVGEAEKFHYITGTITINSKQTDQDRKIVKLEPTVAFYE